MLRLNDREEEIMNIIWRLKKAFPKEILEEIEPPVPPYNTVLSVVRKLEKNGYLSFDKIGKSHRYFAKISKRAYQKSIFGHLLQDYFGGSPEKLLSFFIKEEKISDEELQEIIAKHKKHKK